VSRQFATQRDPDWANDFDPAAHQNGPGPGRAGVFDEDFIDQVDPEFLGEPLQLVPLGQRPDLVRSSALLQNAHEIGTWSLEYLGPGFHVQLRIVRRNRQARLDGWMSPARPITVLLASLLRKPIILETRISDSGRFEFPVAPTGACRMSFIVDDAGRPPSTPPFWV
jgi:hypothetical protein